MKRILISLLFMVILVLMACTPATAPAQMPSPKASILPTQEPISVSPEVTAGPPDLSTMVVNTLTSVSPYGPWTAEAMLVALGETDYVRLILHRVDESGYLYWRPYEEWSESGLGDSLLSEFYWSSGGRYLYFAHKGVAHPCGFPFTTNLCRVDLEDGSLTNIPLTGIGLDDITISPGAEMLVYRVEEGLLVYELESGSTRILPFQWPQTDFIVVGSYAWSPDRVELGFTVTEALCDMPGEQHSSLQIVNIMTGTVRSAEETDSWLYLPENVPVDPIATSVIVLQDFLNSLYWGGHGGRDEYTYEMAVDLYGGSYESLLEMNPEVHPDDKVALFRNACEVNGFQCLRLSEVISSHAARPDYDARLVFLTVRLMNPDRSIFALGSCCGGESGLPETWFGFSVRHMEDGTFKVMDLPPLLP